MGTESTKKIANPNMHYGHQNLVGVIMPPNKINRVSAYSRTDANAMFNKLHADAYTKTKNSPPPAKGGFPTILKILTGIIGISSLVLFGKSIKNGLVKFIRNLTK